MHLEIDGKTITGRMVREWYEGMESSVNGRGCRVLRFSKNKARVLVRWLEENDYTVFQLPGNVSKGRTQWVGRYQIVPHEYVPNYPR
jgi:hypothetical protein